MRGYRREEEEVKSSNKLRGGLKCWKEWTQDEVEKKKVNGEDREQYGWVKTRTHNTCLIIVLYVGGCLLF